MNIPQIYNLDIEGKRVLVRADLDIDLENFENDLRIRALSPTLDYLQSKNAQIILIAHRGRPEGKIDENLSLKPFQQYFDKWGAKLEENLRFDPGEETNDPEFTRKLASLADVYINEAFASSHREHASIVGLPKLLPHAAGFHFVREVENLSKVLENPQRPVMAVISGLKEDKLKYVEPFLKMADKILIAGRLPDYIEMSPDKWPVLNNEKILIAKLLPDKEDITINTIESFEEELKKAGTIVLSGPIGKYEDEGHKMGTRRVFEAVVNSSAFRVAGGGDTEQAINAFGLYEKFDWVSVGGGAMLEFLSKGTLPGIKALFE